MSQKSIKSRRRADRTAKQFSGPQPTGELHTPQREKRGMWYDLLGVVLCMVCVSYFNSLNNQFVFDDIVLIRENRAIRGIENASRLLGIGKKSAFYRPLRTVSHALDYTLNKTLWHNAGGYRGDDEGINPFGYHLSNVVYHLVVSVLVFLVVCQLAGHCRIALLAAALFALHPVHTDSVTYISGRRDILFTLFYLLGFYWFLKFRETGKKRFLGGVLAAYGLSLGSKEMGVTLPLLCFCYDVVDHFTTEAGEAGGNLRKLWVSAGKAVVRWWYLYVPTFAGALAYSYYKVAVASASAQRGYYGDSMLTTFLTVGRILVHYMGLMLYPVRLIADYSFNAFPLSDSFLETEVVISFIVLGAVGYGILWLLGRNKMGALGIIWFFVTLLPVCQIFPHHELLAEHYLYLPSVGICFGGALALNGLLGNKRYAKLTYGVIGVVVILFSLRIVDRNRDWEDGFTLWSKTVKTVPRCARALDNLGLAYTERGMIDKAIDVFRQALTVKPDYGEVYSNLGIAYARKRNLQDAIAAYKRAIALTPRYAEAYYNLGIAYDKQGSLDEAIAAYGKALDIKPRYVEALNNMGSACQRKGDFDAAINYYKQILSLRPDFVKAYNNLGSVYYSLGRLDEAIAAYGKVLDIAPNYTKARYGLGQAYLKKGEVKEAIAEFEKILALNQGFPGVYKNLAWLYATSDDPSLRNGGRAVLLASRACELTRFKSGEALNVLAAAHAEQGQFDKAVDYQQKALQYAPDHLKEEFRKRLKLYQAEGPTGAYLNY